MKYPVTGRSSIIECPVHKVCVPLNSAGRIKGRCIFCVREARRAQRKITTRSAER